MSFRVRKAVKDDMPAILGLIQELAEFEKMSDGPTLKVKDLCRDGGFDDNNSSPLFYSFVAEERASQTVIGYALCFFSYSTWQGRSLFVEDLYVKPDYRKQGIGKMLFVELAKFAEESNCMRFDLHVLDWNPARSFYEKLGGKDLTNAEGWHFCRFDRKAISALANKPN